MKSPIAYFWFRRDLRIEDNVALSAALQSGKKVQPIFIFDQKILDELPKSDARVQFIHESLAKINDELKQYDSSLRIEFGDPEKIWDKILTVEDVSGIYSNKDYEPYARKRDGAIRDLCLTHEVGFFRYKDQVIFEEKEVVKDDGTPYTVFTPYKKKWLSHFYNEMTNAHPIENNWNPSSFDFPSLEDIGFEPSEIRVKKVNLDHIGDYEKLRDFPDKAATSNLSPHLRFGTVSVRKLVAFALKTNATFLSELIWREFFMQIIYNFPDVVLHNFKRKYDHIPWRNNKEEFQAWCEGRTGYPMVDAGMRELNETGYMHNRVRMVVASFLCKHLLIDWRWGEAYFAEKLLDFDLSANNGNWQWAAGTGCDAAPYFRVFNPASQQQKFDPDGIYIRKWVKDLDELTYPSPIVEHKVARERAISEYKAGLAMAE